MMKLPILALPFVLLMSLDAWGQADERVAYAPQGFQTRVADDVRLGPAEGGYHASGMVVPEGTYRIDLLNAKGNVKRVVHSGALSDLELGKLRSGTWTLRAHTRNGLIVRRFAVIDRGNVIWSVPTRAHRK